MTPPKQSDIKPYQVILISLFFAAAIIAYFWLVGERNKHTGVTIVSSHGSQLAMQLNQELLLFEEGNIRTFHLADYGIERLFGEINFLPNGDVLLNDLNTNQGLKRCNLDVGPISCELVLSKSDFGDIIYSANAENGEIFISDSDKHALKWYDSEGELKVTFKKGLKYPSQVSVINQTLYLANTDKHRISLLDLSELGDNTADYPQEIDWQHYQLDEGISKENSHTFPLEFVKLEKQIAVLSATNRLNRGNIYLLDQDGQAVHSFDLPDGADLFSMTLYKGEIIASDVALHTLHRFSLRGEYLGEFIHPELNKRIEHHAQQYEFLMTVSNLILILAGIVFVVLLVIGIWLEKQRNKLEKNNPQVGEKEPLPELEKPEIDNPEIKWLDHHKPWIKDRKILNYTLNIAVVIGFLVVFYSLYQLIGSVDASKLIDDPETASLFVPVFLMPLGMLVLLFFQIRKPKPRCGVFGQWIILVDSKGRDAMVEAPQLRYMGAVYIANDVHVVIGNQRVPVFDKVDVETHIAPLLLHAQEIGQLEYWRYLWKIKDSQFILGLVLVPLIFIQLLSDLLS